MRTILTTLHSKFIHNSLALPYLAAYCGTDCGEMIIREFTVHEPRESILAMLVNEAPDAIVFSVYIWNRRETLELIDTLHAAKPELRVVLGGPEINSYDKGTLFEHHPGLRALVFGEGELPLRALLQAWNHNKEPGTIPRLIWRSADKLVSGHNGPVVEILDSIPSPFKQGLVSLDRGLVYYETSRGCPFKCSFCLSAKSNQLRTFSMTRIQSDLLFLMQHDVPTVKLVDRTFNFSPRRTLEIFEFILEHNRSTNFHFEIAAHLLDDATLMLLEKVPRGMFQFEIGVQSTLESTLSLIDRQVNLQQLEANVIRLRQKTQIHLHLDLVAGLPGERYADFLNSISRVVGWKPHHLQIEAVKVLPGTPLHDLADQYSLRFDPSPPYTILGNLDMNLNELIRLKEISRLVDLLYNSGKFPSFLQILSEVAGSFSAGLERLAAFWREHGWFRFPQGREAIYEYCWAFVRSFSAEEKLRLKEALAYDYALNERIILSRIPAFFTTDLQPPERTWVQQRVKLRTEQIRGKGIKLQYFAARFSKLSDIKSPTVFLFFYLTQPGGKMQVEEQRLNANPFKIKSESHLR